MQRGWGRRGPTRIGVGAVAIGVVALTVASCSIVGSTDDDGGVASEPASTSISTSTTGSGLDPAPSSDGSIESDDPDRHGADLWEPADDGVFEPDSPSSSLAALVPGTSAGQPWIVVGDVRDPGTGNRSPTVWEFDDPSGGQWRSMTLDLPSGVTSGQVADVVRFGDLVVAVGGRGRDDKERPAVWVSDARGWSGIDPDVFDGPSPSWFSQVVADPSGDRLVALGWRIDDRAVASAEVWMSADGSAWAQAVELMPDVDRSVGAVAAGPPGIVVSGSTRIEEERTAAVWFSADGAGWTTVLLPAPGALRSRVQSVTWFADRFVAVGSTAAGSEWEPASWTSEDGVTWSADGADFEIDTGGFVSSAGFEVGLVAAVGDRLMATATGLEQLQPVWESADGSRWTIVADVRAVQPDGVEIDALAGADGVLVGITEEPSTLVFDGQWRRVVPDPDVVPTATEFPFVTEVVAADDGFIAVGGLWDGYQRSAASAWRSDDGTTWVALPQPRAAGFGSIAGSTSQGEELVAVGSVGLWVTTTPHQPAGVLWTYDGSAWNTMTSELFRSTVERTFFEDVASVGQGLAVVGLRFGAGREQGVEPLLLEFDGSNWVEVATGLGGPSSESLIRVCAAESGAAMAVGLIAHGSTTDVAILVRQPSGAWSEAALPELVPSTSSRQIAACSHGDEGFLVAGWNTDAGDDDLLLWTSPDGVDWSPVDGLPAAPSDGTDQWATGAAATGAGFLVVGRDESTGPRQVAVWFGASSGWQRFHLPPETDGMQSPFVAERDGTVVVGGWDDGAVRLYTADLAALVAAADGEP